MKPIIVTSGIDSEYVLKDLSNYLRSRRFQVYEFDFGVYKQDARPLLSQLSRSKVAYITSAHTNLTYRLAKTIAPQLLDKYPNYMSPLEVLSVLRPWRSLYVPHDLLTPFGESNLDEYRFLDLFDHILAPYDAAALASKLGKHTSVHTAGWVKLKRERQPTCDPAAAATSDGPRIVLFISNVVHLHSKYGAEGIADYLQSVLLPGVRVKLPAWSGIESIEAALRERSQATIVSAEMLSTDLIAQADLVLCNSPSSILAESILMGVPAICLLDDEAESMPVKQAKLSQFPEIVFHDYTARTPIPDALIRQALSVKPKPQLKAFDFALVEQLLLNRWTRPTQD